MDQVIFSEGFRALVLVGFPITIAGIIGGIISLVLTKLLGAQDSGLQYLTRGVLIGGVILVLGLGFVEQLKYLFEVTLQ